MRVLHAWNLRRSRIRKCINSSWNCPRETRTKSRVIVDNSSFSFYFFFPISKNIDATRLVNFSTRYHISKCNDKTGECLIKPCYPPASLSWLHARFIIKLFTLVGRIRIYDKVLMITLGVEREKVKTKINTYNIFSSKKHIIYSILHNNKKLFYNYNKFFSYK